MQMSADDTRAIRQQLARVTSLAAAAAGEPDTASIFFALRKLRWAVLDAIELVRAVEESTRNNALREVEVRLEQRVGMEAEHL